MRNKYFLLPLILLITSIGFSSTAFAIDDSVFSPAPSIFDLPFNYNLIDVRPITLDQLTNNLSDDLTVSKEISSIYLTTESETALNNSDDTSNQLVMLLFAISFGVVVLRMSDSEPIPLKYTKLATIAIIFAMGSLLTSQAVVTGNSLWGYAYAEALKPEVILPDAIDSLQFDHSDKSNISFEGGTTILEQENNAIMFDGINDYLVLESNLPTKLESFTASAWIKPDYTDGSAIFAVIGASDAFQLSINNNVEPKKIATFTVYDGIKWHTVQSTSEID